MFFTAPSMRRFFLNLKLSIHVWLATSFIATALFEPTLSLAASGFAHAEQLAFANQFAPQPYCELRCSGTAFGRWRGKGGKMVETLPVFTKQFDVFPIPIEQAADEPSMRRWVLGKGMDLCMRAYCPKGSYRPGSYALRCRIGALGDSEIPVDAAYVSDPESVVHVLRCLLP